MKILRQYIDGDYIITEFTNDGINVSRTIIEAIPGEPGEPLPPPENPITKLQQENAELKYRINLIDSNMLQFMEFILG